MGVQHATISVEGMTCTACESRISRTLLTVNGVIRAEARVNGGKVKVEYDDTLIDRKAIEAVIDKTGYAVRTGKGAGTMVSLGIGLLLAAAYFAASSSGAFSALPTIDASIGYAMLFVAGLLTSIHCVAMCGGIALSQSVRLPDPLSAAAAGSRFNRLNPGLLYNAGRVLSYTIIGGIVGSVGAAFNFSPTLKGLIAGLAGAFMVVLGLRMLGLLDGLPRITNILPARWRDTGTKFAAGFRNRGPFAVGLFNGLMPCGPLQTMQLYALGTGSALAGAFSMLVFSLGTVPLMLLFSVTAALLPRKFVPAMVRASAVLVMVLGFVTLGRAAAVTGLSLPSLSPLSFGANQVSSDPLIVPVIDRDSSQSGMLKATVADGIQTVTTEFTASGYMPFAVQVGIPLKWIIRIKAEDITGCNSPMTVPSYGIRKKLVPGDNLVEFTPKKEGTITYSCWMGMITSKITVLGNPGAAAPADPRRL